MKKYFFVLLSIFGFLFLTDNVFALEYTVDDETYQVTDIESYRDFCYFTYVKDNYNIMFIYNTNNTLYYCAFTNVNLYYFLSGSDKYIKDYNGVSNIHVHRTSYAWNYDRDDGFSSTVRFDDINYSNVNIYSDNSLTTVYFDSNFSFNEIEKKYSNSYSDIFDSTIHNISISILGDDVPIEFDFIYILFDFIILLLLVFTIVFPFIITIKLLGGNL